MKRSRNWPLGEGDGKAELVEFADELDGEPLAIGSLKVIGAKFLVAGAPAQHPIGRGQDRGGDRDDRLLRSTPGAQTSERGGQVAGFGAGGAPGGPGPGGS